MHRTPVTTLDPATGWDAGRAELLAGRFADFPGPAYKRAYLEGLLRSGQAFLQSGNARSAAYCLDKVEGALEEAEALFAKSAHDTAQASAVRAAEAAGAEAASRGGRSSKPPLEQLRADWRADRLRKAEDILSKHGPRLTTLERRAYAESLTKWEKAVRDAADSPAASSAARRADHALLDLRRRLYGRILKSQRAHLVRRGGGGSLALVQVHQQFPGPIGPYNDRQNLEGVLTLLAQADPAWVEEFLELYKGLADLKALIGVRPVSGH